MDNVSEAALFKIVSEEGVSKGVRRIEAWTGDLAAKAVGEGEQLIADIKAAQGSAAGDLTAAYKKMAGLVGEVRTTCVQMAAINKELKKLSDLDLKAKKALAAKAAEAALASVGTIAEELKSSGAKFLVHELDVFANGKALKKASDTLSKSLPAVPTLFYSAESEGGKLAALAYVPADSACTAQEWASSFLSVIGGKGGGKGTTCTGAAKTSENLPAAVDAAKAMASEKFN